MEHRNPVVHKEEPEWLSVLCCPQCRTNVRIDELHANMICPRCSVAYPIRYSIPVMIPNEGKQIPKGEHHV